MSNISQGNPITTAETAFINSISGGQTYYVAASNSSAAVKAMSQYVCTGTNDDVKIQSALTAAAASGGGTVVLSTGTFNIATTIQLPVIVWDIRLTGQGRNTILKAVNSFNNDVLYLAIDELGDCQRLELDNFKIDGNASNQSSGNGIHLHNPTGTHIIWKSSFHDLFLYNVKNNGFYFNTCNTPEACYMNVLDRIWSDSCGVGLYLSATIWTEVSNIEIYNPTTYGIFMNGIVSQMQFVNVRVEGRSAKTADGISGTVSNSSFTNCQVTYCGKNFDITTIEGIAVHFINCFSFGSTHWGFKISTQSYNNHQVSIVGCFSSTEGSNAANAANERVGFWLEGGGQFSMVGCTIEGDVTGGGSRTTQYGIRHNPTATTMVVSTVACFIRDCNVADFYNSSGTSYEAQWGMMSTINNVGYAIPANTSITVPAAANHPGLVVNQDDTTNNPNGVTINNTTNSNSLFVNQSTGSNAAVYVQDSSTNGNFAGLYLGSARTGQSVELHNSSSGKVMSVNADGTGVGIYLNMASGNSANALDLRKNAVIQHQVNSVGQTVYYGAVATAGWGQPAIYGSGRSTAQSALVASVATYTVGAADGSFLVSANVNVTASVTHNFTVTCTYTDETNTSRTLTMNFTNVGGTIATTITNAGGAVPYEGIQTHIRCKASTAITIATVGTFTSVTYNVEGTIMQIA